MCFINKGKGSFTLWNIFTFIIFRRHSLQRIFIIVFLPLTVNEHRLKSPMFKQLSLRNWKTTITIYHKTFAINWTLKRCDCMLISTSSMNWIQSGDNNMKPQINKKYSIKDVRTNKMSMLSRQKNCHTSEIIRTNAKPHQINLINSLI